MIISTKGVSVTAARRLIDEICGENNLPLFVLHDFDVAGFLILGTLNRDTRRYQFSNTIEPSIWVYVLRTLLVWTRTSRSNQNQSGLSCANNSPTTVRRTRRSPFFSDERVELNALTSDQLIAMIERKLKASRHQEGHSRR